MGKMTDSKKGASRRVTIMLDDDLDQKLRTKQAQRIKTTSRTYSFSKTLNEELRKGFRA